MFRVKTNDAPNCALDTSGRQLYLMNWVFRMRVAADLKIGLNTDTFDSNDCRLY